MNRFIFLLFFATSSIVTFAQTSKVLTLNIKGSIDARTSRYIKLGLEKAHSENYNLVFVDMNTYGGTVFDGDKIVSMFLDESLPIYIYIDKNAGSAGSYIAISCDSIFMAPGSIMGASTVVNENMEVLSEKIQSAMRSKMRTTAQTQGRNPRIAEEFVGTNLHSDSTYVRVLTNQEAITVGYCEGVFKNKEDLFKKYGLENATIDTYTLDSSNQVIDFFLNPAVKSILILLIFGGIYMEFKTPGIGIAAIISLSATLLYFIPDYMHGLLAHWEILVFIIGIILIILEVFVIPGFGMAGVTGIVLIFLSLLLSMIQNDFFDFDYVGADKLNIAFRTVAIGFIGSIVFLYLTGSLLIKSKAFQRIALTNSIDFKVNTAIEQSFALKGKTGIAYTVLRPSGKVKINDTIYDATSRGGFINQNEEIIVINDQKSSLKVKSYNQEP